MTALTLCVLWSLAMWQGDSALGGTAQVLLGQCDKPFWCWVPDLLWRAGVLVLTVESQVGRNWGWVEICVWCPLPENKFNLDKGSARVLENVGIKALEKFKFILNHNNMKGCPLSGGTCLWVILKCGTPLCCLLQIELPCWLGCWQRHVLLPILERTPSMSSWVGDLQMVGRLPLPT